MKLWLWRGVADELEKTAIAAKAWLAACDAADAAK